MAGYIGTKAVLLSTTAAAVTGDMTVGGAATISGPFTSKGIDDNAAATAMTLDASGNVGIGTATPTNKLDLAGGITVQQAAPVKWQNTARTATYGSINSSASAIEFDWNGVEAMRIDSSGNLLVGTTSVDPTVGTTETGIALAGVGYGSFSRSSGPSLVAGRNTTNGSVMLFKKSADTVGSVSVTTSATAYNTSSDYRLKENITPVQGAADIVKAMQPVTYTFKSDGSWHDGFLAHELQELHPRAVIGEKDAMVDEEYEVTPAVYEDVIIPAVDAVVDEDGNVTQEAQPERTEQRLVSEAVMGTRSVPEYQGVDYSKLTPILTAALQEALNKIDALEARLTALEAV